MTMRPYTYYDKTHWKDKYIQRYNSEHKFNNSDIFRNTQEREPTQLVFCGDKYYLEFVETYGFYPNINDYITFCFNRIMNNKFKLRTMPNIIFDDIIEHYQLVINQLNISPDKFTSIAKSSRDRAKRVTMEFAS